MSQVAHLILKEIKKAEKSGLKKTTLRANTAISFTGLGDDVTLSCAGVAQNLGCKSKSSAHRWIKN